MSQLTTLETGKSLEELLLEEQSSTSSYAPGYEDINVMKKFIPGKCKTGKQIPFKGILFQKTTGRQRKNSSFLIDLVPGIQKYVLEEEARTLLREREAERNIILKEENSLMKSLPSKHLKQRPCDLKSALGSYFQFIRLIEADFRNCDINEIQLSLLMLLDIHRISGYVRFCQVMWFSPRTRRNKSQALTKIVKRFRESPVLFKHKAAEINACITKLREASNLDSIQANQAVAIIWKENDLVNSGNFMTRIEKVTFIKWLHARLLAIMKLDQITGFRV